MTTIYDNSIIPRIPRNQPPDQPILHLFHKLVTGYGHKEVFPDGWIQYAGFNGSAHIAGSRIRVGY